MRHHANIEDAKICLLGVINNYNSSSSYKVSQGFPIFSEERGEFTEMLFELNPKRVGKHQVPRKGEKGCFRQGEKLGHIHTINYNCNNLCPFS